MRERESVDVRDGGREACKQEVTMWRKKCVRQVGRKGCSGSEGGTEKGR